MNEHGPNWVQKVTLASNILQNVQLQELQSTLRALGQIEAEKLRLDSNRQDAVERENRLREHVWRMERDFGGLLRDSTVTISALYILANQVEDNLVRFGVGTDSFSQFGDKDRVSAFGQRVHEAIENTRQKLLPEQKAEIEMHLEYSVDIEELKFLLEKHKNRSAFGQAVDQWEHAARKLGRMLDPLIEPKAAHKMRALEEKIVAAEDEAKRIDNGPDHGSDEAFDKWTEADDRRDDAFDGLRSAIHEACEKIRVNPVTRRFQSGSSWNRFASFFGPSNPIPLETTKEIFALEEIMRTNAEVASRPPDLGGAKFTELQQKHGIDAEK